MVSWGYVGLGEVFVVAVHSWRRARWTPSATVQTVEHSICSSSTPAAVLPSTDANAVAMTTVTSLRVDKFTVPRVRLKPRLTSEAPVFETDETFRRLIIYFLCIYRLEVMTS